MDIRSQPTVVFDIGNVLLDWSPRHLYRKIFDDPERMEWFLAHVCTPDWNLQQDAGRTFLEATAERIALFPDWEHEICAFDTRWLETIAGPIPQSVEVLQALVTRGVPVYAITNFSAEKWPVAQANFDFLRLFSGVVVSGEERIVKPASEIYHCLLSRFNLDAGSCVFIDDSISNVAGARSVGMTTVHFEPQTDLRSALNRFGIII
jgi:2-haloacid dehalogenase